MRPTARGSGCRRAARTTCWSTSSFETGAPFRRRSRKHTALACLTTIQTLRFTLFHRAATLVAPSGVLTLRLATNPATQKLYQRIEQALARAA